MTNFVVQSFVNILYNYSELYAYDPEAMFLGIFSCLPWLYNVYKIMFVIIASVYVIRIQPGGTIFYAEITNQFIFQLKTH